MENSDIGTSVLTVSATDADAEVGISLDGVVALWCNPLNLQPEHSGGVGSKPGMPPPLGFMNSDRC